MFIISLGDIQLINKKSKIKAIVYTSVVKRDTSAHGMNGIGSPARVESSPVPHLPIGHFRVAVNLILKARLNAKPSI